MARTSISMKKNGMTTGPLSHRFQGVHTRIAELERPSGTASFHRHDRPSQPFESQPWFLDDPNVYWNVRDTERLSSRLYDRDTLLDHIVACTPVGLAVVQGYDHRYMLVNPAYEARVAIANGSLLGRSATEVFPGAVGSEVRALLNTVYRTGESIRGNIQTLSVDDDEAEEVFWRNDLVPLREADGVVTAVLIVTYDVTEGVLAGRSSATPEAHYPLDGMLDYRSLLTSVARLALPTLADSYVADMVEAAVGDQHPRVELKHKFIHNLLHGLIDDEATVLREARILGMDFGSPRAVILIDAAEYILESAPCGQHESTDVQIRRRAQQVISSVVSFFHLPNDTICAYIGDGEVAVLKASNTKNLVTWADRRDVCDQSSSSWANLSALRRASEGLLEQLCRDTNSSVTIGIGRHHPGICGLARSYQDARAALSLGRHFHGPRHVHGLDRLGIASFVGVADERTKIDLATYLLSPLDHEPDLISTLDAFFAANCCPSTAASKLSIHRNTLGYRLDKITALTGLDPRRFDDAVQIRLALVLRSLRSTAS